MQTEPTELELYHNGFQNGCLYGKIELLKLITKELNLGKPIDKILESLKEQLETTE